MVSGQKGGNWMKFEATEDEIKALTGINMGQITQLGEAVYNPAEECPCCQDEDDEYPTLVDVIELLEAAEDNLSDGDCIRAAIIVERARCMLFDIED
jgi:hypothetical protein